MMLKDKIISKTKTKAWSFANVQTFFWSTCRLKSIKYRPSPKNDRAMHLNMFGSCSFWRQMQSPESEHSNKAFTLGSVYFHLTGADGQITNQVIMLLQSSFALSLEFLPSVNWASSFKSRFFFKTCFFGSFERQNVAAKSHKKTDFTIEMWKWRENLNCEILKTFLDYPNVEVFYISLVSTITMLTRTSLCNLQMMLV